MLVNRLKSRFAITTIAVVCATGILAANISNVSANTRGVFKDIDQSYAKNEIIDLAGRGILTGTSAERFSPTQSITRAEYITILDRVLKLEPAVSPVSPYTDVSKSAWYYGYIQAAVQLGIANGASATTFAPSKAVTRQEAAVWMAKALKQTEANSASQTHFNDQSEIASWARAAVDTVNKLGLMKGDDSGDYRPLDPITRQETAVLMDRVLKHEGWSAELDKKSEQPIVIGWQYGQTTAQFESNVLKSNVNTLSPRWYFVDQTGAVSNSTDTSLISWANKNNKQVWALVGNRSNREATHQMLQSANARNSAINQSINCICKQIWIRWTEY